MTLEIIRADHPYDRGYWARFDGKPQPEAPPETVQGWKDRDAEVAFEAECERESQIERERAKVRAMKRHGARA